MRKSFALLFALVTCAFAARAHQPVDGHIYGTAGMLSYRTHALRHSMGTPVLVAPGIIAEGDLSSNGGLEISMFYLRNSFSIKHDDKIFTQELKRFYVAMGYRHWFGSWLSAGLSFSSSYAMGDPKIVQDDFNGARDRPGTSANDVTEYGFVGSVQNELYRDGRYTILLDARYDYSVTAKKGENANFYGVFIGIKYFVQAREKIEDEDE